MKKFLIIVSILLVGFLISCNTRSDKDIKAEIDLQIALIKSCAEKGGIPIISSISSYLTDCKFPPKEN